MPKKIPYLTISNNYNAEYSWRFMPSKIVEEFSYRDSLGLRNTRSIESLSLINFNKLMRLSDSILF